MQATKETLRRVMQLRRAALDAATTRFAGARVAEQLARFAPYLSAEVVFAYQAIGNEVPTVEVIRDSLRREKRVLVPAPCGESFVDLPPERGEGAPLEPGRRPVIVLVPLVAWGDGGERLGRGGGWYDRVLTRLGFPTVGLGYEFQRAHVPTEPWDVRLDYVVTESRIIEFGGVLSERRLT